MFPMSLKIMLHGRLISGTGVVSVPPPQPAIRTLGGADSSAGSVDWLCLARFDSPAAFAALLHDENAGHWTLAPPAADECTSRRYAGQTLVLETDWITAGGAVRVIDFMPPRARTPHLVRIAVGLRGTVAMRSVLRLRFDYGRVVPWVRHDGTQAHAIAGPDRVRPVSAVPVYGQDWDTFADFTVRQGDRVPFVLSWAPAATRTWPRSTPSRPWPRQRSSGPGGLSTPTTRPDRTATPLTGRLSP